MTSSIKVNKIAVRIVRTHTHLLYLTEWHSSAVRWVALTSIERQIHPISIFFSAPLSKLTRQSWTNTEISSKYFFFLNQIQIWIYWTCSNSDPFIRVPMDRMLPLLWPQMNGPLCGSLFPCQFLRKFQKNCWSCACKWKVKFFLPISDRWLSVSLSAHLSTPLHLFSFKFNF